MSKEKKEEKGNTEALKEIKKMILDGKHPETIIKYIDSMLEKGG